MLSAGTTVGGYRIEHVLGEGGMGTVYAAVEPTIQKRVAIKVLRAALSADDATKARFEREARAVNAVRHPAVVEVFAFGQLDDGSPYFVMSLLEGCSLREELDRRGRIAPAEAWRILREIGDALATAHTSNIVHRDLKPDNIFLETFPGKPPRPRVLDFGIAKVLDLRAGLGDGLDEAPLARLTATGAPMGTPAYMAPEQWWGDPTTTQTDQYSFGVVLFELLTGRPPFRSKQFAELLQLHINQPPPSLQEAGFDASPEVSALVGRLLAKKPTDRFDDFKEVLALGDTAFAGADSTSPAELAVAPTMASTSGARLPTPSIRDREKPNEKLAPNTGARALDDAESKSAEPLAEAGTSPHVEPAIAAAEDLGGRFPSAAFAISLVGFAAIYAVGYAGDGRRDVLLWLKNSGFAIFGVLAAFPIALFFLARAARARLSDTSPKYGPFYIALSPIIPSVVSTYTGWLAVLQSVRGAKTLSHGFTILNEGMFEASTARFIGFALTAILLLTLSALFGEAPPRFAHTSQSIQHIERRWSLWGALGLGAIAAGFAILRAPSAALVAGCGALAELIAFARPTTHPDSAHRDARDRALASGSAILLVIGLSLSRVEARESALWGESATRASRVVEIIDAARERQLTIYAFVLTALIFVSLEVLRVRRLRGRERPAPMPLSGWALGAVLLCTAGLDVTFHQLFFAERKHLVEAQSEQFALFAQLDPPSSQAEVLHEPSVAPALQITSESVAINGKRIAKLGALDSPGGLDHIGHDLTNSLATDGGKTDLSLLVDRSVPWGRVTALLALACDGGARRAEILFTRGSAPAIPADAPPEAGELLPGDFGALDITLTDSGFKGDEAAPFALASTRLLDEATATGAPLPLNLGCSRVGKSAHPSWDPE